MAAIFEAEHVATERRVALKLLFPHIMSVASAREKFELEAKVAARVDSPHIVQVLDAGFDEASKSPYLVMELLHGDTLGGVVKSRGPLPPREVVSLLRQVAAGLDAAHGYKDAGGVAMPIVHRDLKPENIFITSERDGAPLVKVLDFGIAKVLSDTGNVSQEVRGTPLYMAFEQVTAGRLSPATDIWALGLIAYYALTGERYWRSANAEGAGVQSLFAEILTLPLEPPSVRMQQQGLANAFGEAFDAWLLECIDREPSRRFPSAGAAVDALSRVFAHPSSIPVRAPGPLRAASAARTATFPVAGAEQPVHAATAPSLSAMSSERAATVPPGFPLPRSWLAGAAGAGALLLVFGAYWLVASDSDVSGAPAAGSPSLVRQALEPPPAASNAPRASAPSASAPSASAPSEPPTRTPVIAPIRGTAAAHPDAGAASDSKGDYPVPSWPPPRLPGEEEAAATATTGDDTRGPPAKAATTAPAPAKVPPAKPAPDVGASKVKPGTKPAGKPKFNPYDMR